VQIRLSADNEIKFVRSDYDFITKSQFTLKKFSNNNLIDHRIVRIDSLGRILSCTDSLSSASTDVNGIKKNYIIRRNTFYKEDKKIIERVDGDGKPVFRNIVYYDSLKNPTMISDTHIFDKIYGTGLQTVEYNYDQETYIYSDYRKKSKKPKIMKGFINFNTVFSANLQGDITTMYWPLSKKSEGIFHEIDYDYDKFGNWIKMIKTLVKQGEPKKVISKTYRRITYKD
jgi:hypothetical protein